MLVDTARPFNDVPVTFGFGRLESKRNIFHCKESNEFFNLKSYHYIYILFIWPNFTLNGTWIIIDANSIKPDTPINVYTRFCLNTAKSKFSLVSPVTD